MGLGLRHLLRALAFATACFVTGVVPTLAAAMPSPGGPSLHAHAPSGAVGQADEDDDEDGDDEEQKEKKNKEGEPAEKPKQELDATDQELQSELESLDETKVDRGVVEVAVKLAAQDPKAKLRVVVFGSIEPDEGSTVRRKLRNGVVSVSVAVDSLADLAAQTGVDFVVLDVPVRPAIGPETGHVGGSFWLLDRAPDAWARGRTGRGVGVAVVDSGVDASGFGRRLRRAAPAATGDAHGHGTFVAGVLAGRTSAYTGVAPGARVYDVNVAQPDGVYTSDVIAGLEWVAANHRRLKIRVVNLSLAETIPSTYRTSPLARTVERLWRSGVVVVVAAGNLGPGSAVYAPANDPFVITVGAVDNGATFDRADDVQASFSATGPTLDGFPKPDLLAPGRRIVSFLPADTTLGRAAPPENLLGAGLASMSGTSFAAPQVAGAAALLLEHHPNWTPDEVKWVLTRTARPLSGSMAGTLDVRAAFSYRGRPGFANRGLRPGGPLGGPAADGADYSGDTWSASSWSSNTWSSNTWSSNTWSSNTWSAGAFDSP